MKKFILISVLMLAMTSGLKAQVEFSVGADIVSSYVWRGAYQTSTAIQPSLGLSAGGFSISAWGSSDLNGYGKEVDFTVGYGIGGLSLSLTDYWWAGEGALNYLDYGKSTDHVFEVGASYSFPEKFPLTLSAYTMIAGADKKLKDGKEEQYFSTYIEASLPFTVKDIGLEAAIGFTPFEGLYAPEAALTNISLKGSKEIKITDSFALPVFGQVILNPYSEGIYFVFGISL
jgi:hypothetical protein